MAKPFSTNGSPNGTPSGSPGSTPGEPEITLNEDQFLRLEEIVHNEMSSRSDLMRLMFDDRRNIYKECGYPEDDAFITAHDYQKLYEREPIPARVIELFPKETWQVTPSVFEVEDGDDPTEFEEAWDNLSRSLRTGSVGLDGKPLREGGEGPKKRASWYQDEEGSPLWEYLIRADVLSGIGRYGVILLGLDDGKSLEEPASYRKNQRIRYLRIFPEAMAEVAELEGDETSPRFCHPKSYTLTFVDPRHGQATSGLSAFTKLVHWTRVIHIADMYHSSSPSEVFAIPRLQQVLNPCLGHRKVSCAAPEMFWKGAFVGISMESPPGIPSLRVDRSRVRAEAENWQNSLQRVLIATGLTVKTHSPQVVDPTPHLTHLIQAICIRLGCPQRIFMGSERGELASSQDDAAWNDRLKARQKTYVTPRVIVPFVDRLIQLGVLPEPKFVTADPDKVEEMLKEQKVSSGKAALAMTAREKVQQGFGSTKKGEDGGSKETPTRNVSYRTDGTRTVQVRRVYVWNEEDQVEEEKEVEVIGTTIKTEAGYSVFWPDISSQNDSEKATVAGQMVAAITDMVAKDGFSVISEKDFWTRVMKFSEEEAQAIIDGAVEQVESDLQLQQDRIEEGLVPDPLAKEKMMADAAKEVGQDGKGGGPGDGAGFPANNSMTDDSSEGVK